MYQLFHELSIMNSLKFVNFIAMHIRTNFEQTKSTNFINPRKPLFGKNKNKLEISCQL